MVYQCPKWQVPVSFHARVEHTEELDFPEQDNVDPSKVLSDDGSSSGHNYHRLDTSMEVLSR